MVLHNTSRNIWLPLFFLYTTAYYILTKMLITKWIMIFRMADYHKEILANHCRVCAKLLAKFKMSYRCADKAVELEKVFSIVVSSDTPPLVHPLCFCHSCYNVLAQAKKAMAQKRPYNPAIQQFTWSAHSDLDCAVCDHFQNVSSGGRPRKRKVGRPSTSSTRAAMAHCHQIAPSSFFEAADYRSLVIQSYSSSVLIDDFACQLCSRVVNRPIQLTVCNKLICLACLCKSLDEREFCCPCCGSDHLKDHRTMVQPFPIVIKILGDFHVSCRV